MIIDIAWPIEFINSLTPNGLPPHKLTLKEGAIVYVHGELETILGSKKVGKKLNTIGCYRKKYSL